MLSETPFVELSDTELLQTAHHLPIALHIEGDEIDVVALLDDRLLNRPLVDDKLRWTPPYIPIRLRCLPFSLGPRTSDASPADRLLIRLDLGLTAAGGERIFADDRTLSRAAATILKALLRLEQGQRKLAAAAELLLLTGILAPLGDAAPECSHGMLYGVESSAFSKMTPLQCAVAGKSDFLPLELAVAMLFSERHLLHRMRPESHVPAAAAKVPQELDLVVQGIEPYPLQLDTSELFRIDELSAEADAGRQGQE